MRRSLLRIGAATTALATGIALASCTSGDNGDTGGPATATATDAFPVSVATTFGDIEIPEQPSRVVALGWGDADIALNLGVQPVGASDFLGFGGDGVSPWNGETYDRSPEIVSGGGNQEVDVEKIAALDPDLILNVKSASDRETYDRLSEIAPTISAPAGAEGYTVGREEQVGMIATALGESAKGDEINREVDDAVARVRDDHPEWAGKTASVVAKYGEGWATYLEGDARLDLLTSLGFTETGAVAKAGEDADTFFTQLSDENLDTADADVVVGFPIGITREEFEDLGPWRNLGAVQAGHAVVADKDLSDAFSLGTPDAVLWALQQITPQLEAATG
ncbi:iron-siderophore ABC transporter substrate-binding protein [Corynebacterium kalidii]|uniref:Iron-siderophore ABC transporter substrate-binding protein n=1 Tax=Corynebacterium kalidii TaxID=2931982 RepID=A0A9X2AY22_9CORY|nr:iron-siderophore ABC transporter substrate-binding protein [Corynebacterium kalidii]MCJ7857621.1 iron-siderophore ABC transporter substrate-binding protein [Corynebacterium kalidii]